MNNNKENPPGASFIDKKTFGKFQLEKKLGQGGMGAVYLASDPVLKRNVALKILLLKGEIAIERFLREARAAAKLKHPNVVHVYEIGNVGKYYYFTMEYIEGESLKKIIQEKKQPLSPVRLAEIVHDIALALHYTHNYGIVHRDIKPSNIIIDSSGRPYVVDFGLAKELSELDFSVTKSGVVIGTPNYMSPEQAKGEKKQIDRRSDIFSLGATFYYCLTGKAPFEGEELYNVLDSVINKNPAPPSSVSSSIHRELDMICLKCLEKDKNNRYQTAKELANDIRRYLKGETISVRSRGGFEKLLLAAKKNKIPIMSFATAIILMIIALFTFTDFAMSTTADVFKSLLLMGMIITFTTLSIRKTRQINTYRGQAKDYFSEGKFEEARSSCERLLALFPNDQEIQMLLKKCSGAAKEREDSLRAEKERADEEIGKLKKSIEQ